MRKAQRQAQSCILNFINGNLSDAKEQARKYSHGTLVWASMAMGFSMEKAHATADYLKHPSNETFNTACNAK